MRTWRLSTICLEQLLFLLLAENMAQNTISQAEKQLLEKICLNSCSILDKGYSFLFRCVGGIIGMSSGETLNTYDNFLTFTKPLTKYNVTVTDSSKFVLT